MGQFHHAHRGNYLGMQYRALGCIWWIEFHENPRARPSTMMPTYTPYLTVTFAKQVFIVE